MAAAATSADPLRGVQGAAISKGGKETEVEFCRLKSLVPTISKKQSVSKLDVILEAIRYIDQLQDQLLDQMNGGAGKASFHHHPFSLPPSLLAGKENTDRALLKALHRQRHRSE